MYQAATLANALEGQNDEEKEDDELIKELKGLIRQHLEGQGVQEFDPKAHNEALDRFLSAKAGNVKAAFEVWSKWYAWRKDYELDNLVASDVSTSLKAATAYFRGRDKQGYPLLFIRPAWHEPKDVDARELIRFGVFVGRVGMELASIYRVPHFSVIWDRENVSSHNRDPKIVKSAGGLLGLMSDCYSVRLGPVFARQVNTVFWAIYKMFSGMIPSAARDKLVVLRSDKEFGKYIDDDQLLHSYGGNDMFDVHAVIEQQVKEGTCPFDKPLTPAELAAEIASSRQAEDRGGASTSSLQGDKEEVVKNIVLERNGLVKKAKQAVLKAKSSSSRSLSSTPQKDDDDDNYQENTTQYRKITIPAGRSLELSVSGGEGQQDGCCISWKFSTEGGDIGFSMTHFACSSTGLGEEMIPYSRVQSHVDKVGNSLHEMPGGGSYVFRFDNSFSYFKAKTLHFEEFLNTQSRCEVCAMKESFDGFAFDPALEKERHLASYGSFRLSETSGGLI